MGAFGVGNFENDTALDWLFSLDSIEGPELLTAQLRAFCSVSDSGDCLTADECCEALAAAELVSALNGKPAANLPEEISSWVKGKASPSDSLVFYAIRASELVLAKSELKDLWEESDEFDSWQQCQTHLLSRLRAGAVQPSDGFEPPRVDDSFPSVRFDSAEASKDGLPANIRLNIAYKRYQFCRRFPFLVEITLRYERRDESGLPLAEEISLLEKLEKDISERLEVGKSSHFIARQFWNGNCMLDYYCKDKESLERQLEALRESLPQERRFSAKVSSDPEWKTWMPTISRF